MEISPSTIARRHLCPEMAAGGGRGLSGAGPAVLIGLLLQLLLLLPLSVQALTITNTAVVATGQGNFSASTSVLATIRTPSTVEFLQYGPGAPGAGPVAVPPASYSSDGTPTGFFANTSPVTEWDTTPIPLPATVDLLPAIAYHGDEPIFIRLTDLDQNLNPLLAETVLVRVTSQITGDSILLRLTETGPDTGIFVGAFQSTANPAIINDRFLSVAINDRLQASYSDIADPLDQSQEVVIVDPYGLLFSTADGGPVNGATVTLWDVLADAPAAVYNDDGTPGYPATVTSGDPSLSFPAGGYRFPFVRPGTYRLQITPPPGFTAPSVVATPVIQGLPGNPFAIVTGSRGEDFILNPGPALRVDVPLDTLSTTLYISKKALKEQVGRGEYLQYSVMATNFSNSSLTGVTLTDRLPAGFRYAKGSSTQDGLPLADPQISADGRTLTFNLGTIGAASSQELRYVVEVGPDTRPGVAVNSASAGATGNIRSNPAQAPVKVVDDLFGDRSLLVGRVLFGNCQPQPAPLGSAALRLNSQIAGDRVDYTATIQANRVDLENVYLVVELPEIFSYQAGSAKLDGRPLPDPEELAGRLRFRLGAVKSDNQHQLSFGTGPRLFTYGEFSIRAHLEYQDPATQAAGGTLALRSPVATNRLKNFSRTIRPRFDTLTAELKTEDRLELDRFSQELSDLPISRLIIIGHADQRPIRGRSRAIFADNDQLSLARAQAVADYLGAKLNLAGEQMIVEGDGTKSQLQYSELLTGAALNLEDQLSINRRVVVLVELAGQQGASRFVVTKDDSGEKRGQALGVIGETPTAATGLDAPGLAKVRLFMEDGRFVVTDQMGYFHFEGLEPGTHVVQVDLDSLPEALEIYQCEENTRFAGVPHSRFVDLQGSTMWRADFYVRTKDPRTTQGELNLRLNSEIGVGSEVIYRIDLGGAGVDLQNRRLTVDMPDGFRYLPGSAELGGQPLPEPVLTDEGLTFDLGHRSPDAWQETMTSRAEIVRFYEGDHTSSGFLRFETEDGKSHLSRIVQNTVATRARRSMRLLYSAPYQQKAAAPAAADLQRLDGVIDFLRGQNITKVNLRFRPAENGQDLPAAPVLVVADSLRRGLSLSEKQVSFSPDPVVAATRGGGRLEVYVTLADDQDPEGVWLKKGDSGVAREELSAAQPYSAAELGRSDQTPPPPVDGILSLTEGQRVPTRIQAVPIRIDARLRPELAIDGQIVSNARIGMSLVEEEIGRKVFSYIGLDLGEPGSHTITLRGLDPFGNARFKQDLTYIRTGAPVAIRVVETTGNLADGQTPVRVRVELLDQAGQPITGETLLTVQGGNLAPLAGETPLTSQSTNPAPQRATRTLPELREETSAVKVDNLGYITFAPVTTSGLHTTTLSYGEVTAEVRTYVKPHYRDWIMVGLAEGTAGLDSVSGNLENLTAADEADGYYLDGRLAFYAKGKIKGEYLLTAAYDSAREKTAADNGLFGTIDPNKYYTLYGDQTEVRYDAASHEKLYLKLEGDRFYALFGDYNTGLTVTELSRYSRSLTGFKGEYQGENLGGTGFVAETDHAFIKDEIHGDGTSGLYRLSNREIVLNSEKITIETRDRFHAETVLTSRQLSRYIDYTFDPVDGTIYFREPIYSRDPEFNPVYIVAEYEVAAGGSRELSGGGRLSYRLSEKGPEAGLSLIHEGTPGARADLQGIDLRYPLDDKTTVKAEAAVTNKTSGGTDYSGSAFLAEIQRHDQRLDAKAYFREQDGDFGLGQQPGSENDTRKFGADGRYRLTDKLALGGELFRQETLGTSALRDVLATSLNYKFEKLTTSGGLRFVREEDGAGASRESSLVTGGLRRAFLADRLDLFANTEVAVAQDAASDYPTRLTLGGEYGLTAAVKIFVAEELTWGENQDTQSTRLGLKATPWREATFNSSLNNQTGEYGPRTFSSLGLTQGLRLSEQLRLDFGLERSDTLRHPGDTPLNVNVPPATGAITDDFTAVSTGATYKEKLWSMTGRAEYRDGEREDKAGLLWGFYREQTPGFGFSSVLRHFDTDRANNTRNTRSELEFSVARRPLDSPWIILNKARLSEQRDSGPINTVRTRKLVNNLNANYLFDRRNQLSLAHGLKYVLDSFDGAEYDGFTQLVGLEYRHDFTAKWDLGVRTATRFSDVGAGAVYSTGLSVGHSFAQNVWLSVGYNFRGFRDDDFSAADYTAQGVYLKCRAKFDQFSARKLLAWWEK